MNTTTRTTPTVTTGTAAWLWKGAALTAVSAVLFPRLNAVIYEHSRIWHLDHEAAVLIPVIVAGTLLLFAAVGAWARRRGGHNRPAAAGLAAGVLAVLGVLAFFVSAPIVFGGLAVTLGLEGLRRAPAEGRRTPAMVAVGLGSLGYLAGAVIWLVGA